MTNQPPFKKGDVVTYYRGRFADSRCYMPGKCCVTVLAEDAQQNTRMSSGWELFGVDSAHFIHATWEHMDEAIDELLGRIENIQRQIDDLELLKERL